MLREPAKGAKPFEGNEAYEGLAVDLAKRVSELVGFEYEFRPVKDGRFGGRNPDGTWNGMIGELTRKVKY